MSTLAFVRKPTESLAFCELTHLARAPIDVALAQSQHAAYVALLSELGARIEWLPPLASHPDAVFVEDTAVLLPELAIIARPGAPSRQDEVLSVARALGEYRPVAWIEEPASLDGGDVLVIGNRIFVGQGTRTNAEGLAALRAIVGSLGYEVVAVPIGRSLHLKSACTFIAPSTVVVNREWVDPAVFSGLKIIATDPDEPAAGNTLTLDGVTMVATSAPRTEEKLRGAGIRTRALDISELQKAEAGITCMSLILPG